MTVMKKGARAGHLEDLAYTLTEIDTRPNDGQYLGMKQKVAEAIDHLLRAMFPYHFGKSRARFVETEKRTYELMQAYDALDQCIELVIKEHDEAAEKVDELINALPEILEILKTDIQAGYEGDPAAQSADEVIITYPAFYAIAIYRIAHKLYEMDIPMIPRIMTEQAHTATGIDIQPGATIGRYFFIDHGTGVVIGETTTIGEHVKIYQHVTLGAKSFAVNENGSLVKGIKRHPDIGNNVIIYAGATILGGDTKIGDDCVVGGNVWLTQSLEPGETIVTNACGQHRSKDRKLLEESIEWFI